MSQIGKFLNLKPHMTSWAVYNVNGPYTSPNKIGSLAPSQFGGLSYKILEEKGGDIYIIQTDSYGKCAIWAPADNDSSITTSPTYSNGNTGGGGSNGGIIIPGDLKVFIDPGHGGSDPGAIGNGLNEKDVVLAISKKLGLALNSKGVSVKYARTTDEYVSLEGRSEQANAWGANLFVSVHANSATAAATGTECYTKPAADSKTKQLSANIASAISSKFGIVNRGHKEEVWRVLMLSNMPAILIETAFISNSGDANLLRNRQGDFATVISDKIVNYLGISTNRPTNLELIKELASLSVRYCYENSLTKLKDVNKCILDYLRHIPYNTNEWILILGELSPFVKYVVEKHPTFHNKILKYINSSNKMIINNSIIDIPHLAATIQVYINSIIDNPVSLLVPNFWTGWGGDLAKTMADITRLKLENYPNKSEQDIAENYVIANRSSSFSEIDIEADIDAIEFAEKFTTARFDILFENYYNSVNATKRKSTMIVKELKMQLNSPESYLTLAIREFMTGTKGFGHPAGRKLSGKASYNGIAPNQAAITGACSAFAKYLLAL